MAKKQLTVEIIKSKTDVMWYRDNIGSTYKVREVEGKHEDDYYEQYLGQGRSRIIFKEDCKQVKSNKKQL